MIIEVGAPSALVGTLLIDSFNYLMIKMRYLIKTIKEMLKNTKNCEKILLINILIYYVLQSASVNVNVCTLLSIHAPLPFHTILELHVLRGLLENHITCYISICTHTTNTAM